MLADFVIRGRGVKARVVLLAVSQLLAAPFAAGALYLEYPLCFLTLLPNYLLGEGVVIMTVAANVKFNNVLKTGEMWIGVAFACVLDIVPVAIRTTSVALFAFILNMIGGNMNLLVSPLESTGLNIREVCSSLLHIKDNY